MHIIWSNEAIEDYYKNIDYLLANWSEISASNFINEVEIILEIIVNRPEIFPISDFKSVRKAVINKRISLFYTKEDNSVILLRFWNNYQNPESFNF